MFCQDEDMKGLEEARDNFLEDHAAEFGFLSSLFNEAPATQASRQY